MTQKYTFINNTHIIQADTLEELREKISPFIQVECKELKKKIVCRNDYSIIKKKNPKPNKDTKKKYIYNDIECNTLKRLAKELNFTLSKTQRITKSPELMIENKISYHPEYIKKLNEKIQLLPQ